MSLVARYQQDTGPIQGVSIMAKPDEPQGSPLLGGAQRLTPVDVQQKQFRLAFRGYNEREVDEFLDQVTEELARLHAENRRWQEELEARRTMPLATGGAAETERILAQARQEAARILADAEEEARSIRADAQRASKDVGFFSGRAGLSSGDVRTGEFLGREKEFLQRLAGIIQEHAEAVKQDLRDIREAPPATPPPGPSAFETAPELSEARDEMPPPVTTSGPSAGAAGLQEAEAAPEMKPFGSEADGSEPGVSGLSESELEPAEAGWTPSPPEVEVVESAEPLQAPGPPGWEGGTMPEPEPQPEPEPTAEPEPEQTSGESWPTSEDEPATEGWEPTEPEPPDEPPGPTVSEPEDGAPQGAWTAVEETSTLLPSGEGEPETWAGPGRDQEELEPDILAEGPTPSWQPPAGTAGWDEPPEEPLQAEEFLFEQPTLTGEPAPSAPPSEEEFESGPDAPQAFDRGAGDDNDEDGDDRSLRELFWGED